MGRVKRLVATRSGRAIFQVHGTSSAAEEYLVGRCRLTPL